MKYNNFMKYNNGKIKKFKRIRFDFRLDIDFIGRKGIWISDAACSKIKNYKWIFTNDAEFRYHLFHPILFNITYTASKRICNNLNRIFKRSEKVMT